MSDVKKEIGNKKKKGETQRIPHQKKKNTNTKRIKKKKE